MPPVQPGHGGLGPWEGYRINRRDRDAFCKRGSEGEESQQVAAGKRSDEGLFGIDAVGVAEVLRGGGGLQAIAVLEGPGMVPGVILVSEVETVAVPGKIGFVFGHRLFLRMARFWT